MPNLVTLPAAPGLPPGVYVAMSPGVIADLTTDLIKIKALCDNPHWNIERKYLISRYAEACLAKLK